MKKRILCAILTVLMAAIGAKGSNNRLEAAIDTVQSLLTGQNPLAELNSANAFLITRADIDYAQYEQIFGGYMIPFALTPGCAGLHIFC